VPRPVASPAKPPALRTRISNEARTAETRRRVFEAAVTCLNTLGYAGTTMAKIAATAGVTRGAVQHVYGDRRVDLMHAVAEELYTAYFEYYQPILQNNDGPRDLLDKVWDLNIELFKSAETTALIELWLAMRGDEELRAVLLPFFESRDQQLSDRWDEEFGTAGLSPQQIQTIRYTQRALLRGLAIELIIQHDDETLTTVIELARRATLAMFDAPGTPDA